MQPLSNTIISAIPTLLVSRHLYSIIQAQTSVSAGSITKIHQQHCPKVAVSLGGHPRKLTTTNITFAKCGSYTRKIKTTVHAAKVLSTVNNQHITPQTVRNVLKATRIITVSKQKKPLLTQKHRRARLEFAERHLE